MKIPDGLMEEPCTAFRKERATRKCLIHSSKRGFFDQFVTSFAPSLVTKIVTEVTIYISLQVHRLFPVLGEKHAAKRRFFAVRKTLEPGI
jgi:hypothetical protein